MAEQQQNGADLHEDDSFLDKYQPDFPITEADLRDEAFYGPIGEFAKKVGGVYTPSSPLHLKMTLEGAFAPLFGHTPHRVWSQSTTYAQTFDIGLGKTGVGKGLPRQIVRRVAKHVAQFPSREEEKYVVTGVRSGPGFVEDLFAIQSITPVDPDRGNVVTKAWFWTEEFAGTMNAKSRDADSTKEHQRTAYDGARTGGGSLSGKKAQTIVEPCVSISAQTNPHDLLSLSKPGDLLDGWLNRYILYPVIEYETSKPPNEQVPPDWYAELGKSITTAINAASRWRPAIQATDEAEQLLALVDAWQKKVKLTPGILGPALTRVGQNIHRLALRSALYRCTPDAEPMVNIYDVRAAIATMEPMMPLVIELWLNKGADHRQTMLLTAIENDPGKTVTHYCKPGANSFEFSKRQEAIGEMYRAGLISVTKKQAKGGGYLVAPNPLNHPDPLPWVEPTEQLAVGLEGEDAGEEPLGMDGMDSNAERGISGVSAENQSILSIPSDRPLLREERKNGRNGPYMDEISEMAVSEKPSIQSIPSPEEESPMEQDDLIEDVLEQAGSTCATDGCDAEPVIYPLVHGVPDMNIGWCSSHADDADAYMDRQAVAS